MVCCGFLFDLIMVRIEMPGMQFEDPKRLFVIADFNQNSLRITPSRINVVEFKRNRNFEFEMPPQKLRQDLAKNPLKLTVYYNAQPIGIANVPWDKSVLEKIHKNMGELTHIGESALVCCENSTENFGVVEHLGVVEYVYRLQCKCEESSDECVPLPNCDDLKKRVCKTINPEDVLFVISEPEQRYDCDLCEIKHIQTACDKEPFDISPYRFYNGKIINDSEAVNTCYNVDCCELMKTFDPCECLYGIQKKRKSECYCKSCCECNCKMPKSCRLCPKDCPTSSFCVPPCTNSVGGCCKKTKSCATCSRGCAGSGMNRLLNSSRPADLNFNCFTSAPLTQGFMSSNFRAGSNCAAMNQFSTSSYTNCDRQAGLNTKCAVSTPVIGGSRFMNSPSPFVGNCGFSRCFSSVATNRQTSSNCKKCPKLGKSKFMSCLPYTVDPCQYLYDAHKTKACSSSKDMKNEKVYLLCGPPAVDTSDCECGIKSSTKKPKCQKKCNKCPKNENLFLMPCESLNDNMVLIEKPKPHDDLGSKSLPNFCKNSQKGSGKLKFRCDDTLMTEYKRSLKERTQKIMDSCKSTTHKTSMAMPKFGTKDLKDYKKSAIGDLTVDDIMKEFLKDDDYYSMTQVQRKK